MFSERSWHQDKGRPGSQPLRSPRVRTQGAGIVGAVGLGVGGPPIHPSCTHLAIIHPPPIHLSYTHPFTHPSLCHSTRHPSILHLFPLTPIPPSFCHPSIITHLSITHPSIHLLIYPCTHRSIIWTFIHPHIHHLPIHHPSIHLLTHAPTHPSSGHSSTHAFFIYPSIGCTSIIRLFIHPSSTHTFFIYPSIIQPSQPSTIKYGALTVCQALLGTGDTGMNKKPTSQPSSHPNGFCSKRSLPASTPACAVPAPPWCRPRG